MWRLIGLVVISLWWPTVAAAEFLAWDQFAADLDTVRQYRYEATVNGGPLTPCCAEVICLPTTLIDLFTCSVSLATLPAGTYTITLTAVYQGVRSQPSDPFTFTWVIVVPTAPVNLRLTEIA